MHVEAGAGLGDGSASPGDPAAFAQWVGPSLVPMSRLGRRLAPDHDPDDAVQEALTRAWLKRRAFDPARGTATTWLLAITADRARAARRARIRRLRVVDEYAEVPEQSAHEQRADLDLERAIGRLAERQQLAVHLHYFLGLTVEVTAAVLQFDGAGHATLRDGCAGTAPAVISAGSVQLGRFVPDRQARTSILGPDEQAQVARILDGALTWSITDNTLTVTKAGSGALTFERGVAPTR